MKRFLLVAVVFLLPFCVSAQIKAKVTGIKDGDTIEVLLEGNIMKTLRLAEVDCPEKGQPYGKNAKKFTSDRVFGKEIIYIPTSRDRYGRIVAKVFYGNGRYLSAEIIRAGYGWWFYRYSKDKKLEELQKKAMASRKGLWKDANEQAPWEYRKQRRHQKKSRKTAGLHLEWRSAKFSLEHIVPCLSAHGYCVFGIYS